MGRVVGLQLGHALSFSQRLCSALLRPAPPRPPALHWGSLPPLVSCLVQLQPPADFLLKSQWRPHGHSHLLTHSRTGEAGVPPDAAPLALALPCVYRTTGWATALWKTPGPRWSSTKSLSDSEPEAAWGHHTEGHPLPGTRSFHSLRTVIFHR